MKKLKGAIIITLALCFVFSFAGCGNINKEEVGKGTITNSESSAGSSTSTGTSTSAGTDSNDNGKKLDFGTNEGDVYKNDFFGLTVKLPKGWKVASDEEKQKVIDAGTAVVAGDDKSKKTQMELGELKTVYLLMTSKLGLQSQEPSNANFMTMAEKVSLLQGIKKGDDYLGYVKKQLKDMSSKIPYKLDKEIYTEKVGGKDFSVLEASIENEQIKLTQKYYAYITKGYALCFITSSTSEEDSKVLGDMMKSVTLK